MNTPQTPTAEPLAPLTGSATEAARRSAICLSLAYKASNYYDALYLRTGNTAADNMHELAEIFEAEWIKKHGPGAAHSPSADVRDRPA